jgi:hypothetical protein
MVRFDCRRGTLSRGHIIGWLYAGNSGQSTIRGHKGHLMGNCLGLSLRERFKEGGTVVIYPLFHYRECFSVKRVRFSQHSGLHQRKAKTLDRRRWATVTVATYGRTDGESRVAMCCAVGVNGDHSCLGRVQLTLGKTAVRFLVLVVVMQIDTSVDLGRHMLRLGKEEFALERPARLLRLSSRTMASHHLIP